MTDRWIRDTAGRVLLLRGVNLGGDSKIPVIPDGTTSRADSLRTPAEASFVGRPFGLTDADRHLARIRGWGMNTLRLLVTWEAVEHAGPGRHDGAYLDYLGELVERAGRHGLLVLVDPHQDVWSRWTGGDGAPAWTLERAGFRLDTLHASGAALLHQEAGAAMARLTWPTNTSRLACATMFTLFLGGDTFAPGVRIGDESAQVYLQRHYIESMRAVARAVAGNPCVVGFGVMNEPSLGYIGLTDLGALQGALVRKGAMPTPFQGMVAGEGRTVAVDRWKLDLLGERRSGRVRLNPGGARAWQPDKPCIWSRAGVWVSAADGPRLARPDHFRVEGDPVERHYRPFVDRYTAAIREVAPGARIFVDEPPGQQADWQPSDPTSVVHAPHWYDGLPMVTGKSWGLLAVDADKRAIALGPGALARVCRRQIARRVRADVPVFVGEFGLPLDRVGDRAAARALAAYYDALDASLVGGALWCYTATSDAVHGDHWNREDFSIYRAGEARGLSGFCRPCAERIAGTPLSQRFDRRTRVLELRYSPSHGVRAPTVIRLPRAVYPHGFRVDLRGAGLRTVERADDESLHVHHAGTDTAGAGAVVTVVIYPRRPKG